MNEENKNENLFEGNSEKPQPTTFSIDDFDYLLGENGFAVLEEESNENEQIPVKRKNNVNKRVNTAKKA